MVKGEWKLNKKQLAFLLCDKREVLYGGAAGGGKSDALLMAAAQYVTEPNYSALILRSSYADLSKRGALIPRSKEWWLGHEVDGRTATFRGTPPIGWTFPSGATIEFGYCANDDNVEQFRSSEYDFVAFDELTQHTEFRYTYLYSRMRKSTESSIPSRLRGGTNPGGKGHDWVKKRFITSPADDCGFIPATIYDNPAINVEDYIINMQHLEPRTRAQLLEGDWREWEGGRFQRNWFKTYRHDKPKGMFYLEGQPDPIPVDLCQHFGICDPAATAEENIPAHSDKYKDSDYTAIGAFSVWNGKNLIVREVDRRRIHLEAIIPACAALYARNGCGYMGIEATGFQWAIVHMGRRQTGMSIIPLEPKGKSKLVRATPAINMAAGGQIFVPESAPWLDDYLSELVSFTGDEDLDAHDDQVDMTAYACQRVQLGLQGDVLRMNSGKPKESNARARGLFGVR